MNISNFILFQIAWFVTIFSAANGLPYVGVISTLVWISIHLYIIGDKRLLEFELLVSAAVIGYLLDSLLVYREVIKFPEPALLGGPSPIWMVCLWVNLAATINYSLSWLKGRYILSALMAGIAGPFAYVAGEKLGAISLSDNASLIIIGLMWACAMPLLIFFSGRMFKNKASKNQVLVNGSGN